MRKNKFTNVLSLWTALGLLICVFFSANFSKDSSLTKLPSPTQPPTFKQKQIAWADSVLATMTLEEKVGQLFMVSAFSNRNEYDYKKLEEQIIKYHLGGVIFFQGSPLRQADLTNRYQRVSKIPLLVGIDGEWGIGMRLDDAVSFPKAITLGATYDPVIVEKIAYEIGLQCKRMGIHINFAPDADINSNPKNPVINYRSFGESVSNVSNLAVAYSRGLKKAGVMGSAKHFPGHGDTSEDSHRSLPVLEHTLKHILDVESRPFKALIADSIASVMVGHLHVPSLDPAPNTPASVSEPIITGFLKKELNFEGLVVTDALNMRGLLKYFPTGQAEVKAFQAGNDLLLQTGNIDIAYNTLLGKFLDSTLQQSDLDFKVKKILMSKYWAGLNHYAPIDFRTLLTDLNNPKSSDLKLAAFNKATTIMKDEEGLIPLKNLTNPSFASLAISAKSDNSFQKVLSLYAKINNYNLPFKPSKASDWTWLAEEVSKKDLVIVSVHDMHNLESRNFGVVPEALHLIREIQKKTKVIVVVFGNPYSLKLFDEFDTVICGYDDEPEAFTATANVIFGVNASVGKIPVNTLSADGKLDFGIKTASLKRVGFASPTEEGMSAVKLSEIKPIVQNSIANGEFPGCQVLVARKGKVVYYESFGNLHYDADEPVTWNTIYDLASMSKVTGTLQAVMMLYDQNKIDINQKISFYLPELDSTNKKNILVKDLLLHEAGLKAFIPFAENTKNSTVYFSMDNPDQSLLKVSEGLFVIPSIKDSVFKWIAKSSLIGGPKKYLYSDLSLILLQRIVEKISENPMDVFLQNKFYNPLSLENTSYNIYKKKDLALIAPTEITQDFRHSAIKGTVHDPNAALLGGVAGHAGLFSNAWDLARLLQMNLNKGTYEGKRYFSEKTLELFTADQSAISHRGYGWNKPSKEDGSVSDFASDLTYGHTGFTGTCAWVDPKEELIYIFLSNRVYPSADNNKLIKNKTRKRIHDIIYQSIIK